jgi:L-iditol 2-dehydrogenase
MKALLIHGINNIGLGEIPAPQIGPDEVLIKPRASTICHSDFELISGRYIIPFDYPAIPGHEWSGEVIEVGANVQNYKPRDRVVCESVIGCGCCPNCQSGNFTFCDTINHFGFTIKGADAELTKARPEWLHQLPEQMSFKQGALIEPFSVSYGAILESGGTDAGETMVVFGGGPIGLFAVQAGSTMGAMVILVEPMASRHEMGIRLGAESIIDPTKEDVIERVLSLTNGKGADIVIEASGSDLALPDTINVARNSGRIAILGINIGKKLPVEFGKIQSKALTLKGVIGSPYVWERTLTFLNRTGIDITQVVTHDFPLSQAEKAFEIASKPESCIKVMLIND